MHQGAAIPAQTLLGLAEPGGEFGKAQAAGFGCLQETGLHRQAGDLRGQADGAGLLLEMPIHRLPDPPVGIGGKAIATAGGIALHGPDQAERAGLDHIERIELQVADPGLIVACHRNHQAQIGCHHPIHRPAASAHQRC